jgi:uncharacterized membrane protein YoaK (UPF0700 family)
MSGNSISVGMHSAVGPLSTVRERLLPIGTYVLGLICTRIVINIAERKGVLRIASACLAAEILCLIAFMGAATRVVGVVLAALAMGIQAAAIVRFSGVTVYTAFVTGSLVKFSENVAELALSPSQQPDTRKQAAADALWFAGIWLAYVGGAIAGAAAFTARGAPVVLWACVALFSVLCLNMVRPSARK